MVTFQPNFTIVENIKAFAKDFLAGKLKSYIKSEPVPEPAAPGTVATIVGENFADIVLDDTKDVLIELYAPWCGHCKKLVPIYDELAASLKDVENVVIAKMDATANDSPHGKYQAKGYPTIFL
jgi:protein disulfide isomerase